MLAHPFKANFYRSVVRGKPVRKLDESKIINPRLVFLPKRNLLGSKLTARLVQPVRKLNLKLSAPTVYSTNPTRPIITNILLTLKRSKRRSFKRAIQLQFKARRNYISLARK